MNHVVYFPLHHPFTCAEKLPDGTWLWHSRQPDAPALIKTDQDTQRIRADLARTQARPFLPPIERDPLLRAEPLPDKPPYFILARFRHGEGTSFGRIAYQILFPYEALTELRVMCQLDHFQEGRIIGVEELRQWLSPCGHPDDGSDHCLVHLFARDFFSDGSDHSVEPFYLRLAQGELDLLRRV